MVHRMNTTGTSGSGISPEHLRRCLSYLTDHGYRLLSLEDLVLSLLEFHVPDNAVVFTIDDGYEDQAKVAAPIFLEFDCPLTFFVITDMVSENHWPWDSKVSWIISNTKRKTLRVDYLDETVTFDLSDEKKVQKARHQIRDSMKELDSESIPGIIDQLIDSAEIDCPDSAPVEYKPMSWDQARELESKGIRFAPHSKTHRILSRVDTETLEDEIQGSWKVLEKELHNPLKVFCYPTGRRLDFGPREIDILRREKFLAATSTFPGFVQASLANVPEIFKLPRLELPDNFSDFIQYCSWIEQAKYRIRHKMNRRL